MKTMLTTLTGSSVVLTNGATAENVFWQVGPSATLGDHTAFTGSIFAHESDTVTAGSSVAGRVFALTGAVTLDTNAITESDPPVGRWEIVHTSGDNSTQMDNFPGGFSTFLFSDGTGYTYGTFATSICVIDDNVLNVVPTWVGLGGNSFQITMTVNPSLSIVYTGSYALTQIPGDTSLSIRTITGTASGSLDGPSTTGGTPFEATVNATVNFSTPSLPDEINGTVSLGSDPTIGGQPCFGTTGSTVNPLTINPSLSAQSGIIVQMRAEGLDPSSTPTTLLLDGYAANLYTTHLQTPTQLRTRSRVQNGPPVPPLVKIIRSPGAPALTTMAQIMS